MPYGDFVGPIEHDEPEATSATTENETPATNRAQLQYGLGAIVTGLLGCYPGLQGLWVFTALCVLALAVSPVVGSLEASSKVEARTNGGGGCQVIGAGVILTLLAVGAFLVALSMTEGGL